MSPPPDMPSRPPSDAPRPAAAFAGAIESASALLGSRAAALRLLFEVRANAPGGTLAEAALQPLRELSGDSIAACYEELLASDADARQARGAFYTPPALGRRLVEVALEGTAPDRVLDPTCGTGNLLLAAGRNLVARGVSWRDAVTRMHGVDTDEAALEIAIGRLAEVADIAPGSVEHTALRARFANADALGDLPWRDRFDLVVGNPPFGNAIEKRTARSDDERTHYAERFPHAAVGAYDKASLFVERSLELAAPGGRVALVLPRALLAANYAVRLREWIDAAHALSDVVVTEAADHFHSAAVYVSGLVVEAGANGAGDSVRVHRDDDTRALPRPADARWSVLLSPHAALVARLPGDWVRLDALTTIIAGASAGEAYDFLPGVSDARPAAGWKLVTTGSVDPFRCFWGERSTRYLKHDFATPWLTRDVVSSRRAALYDRPKVIVAGLSTELEAMLDADGKCAGAVATIAVHDPDDDPARLARVCAFLNSALARRQYLALHGAQALGGGSVQVTKKKLGELRLPASALDTDSDFDALLEALLGAASPPPLPVAASNDRC